MLTDQMPTVKGVLQKVKKPKRLTWKFDLDLTQPVEDEIWENLNNFCEKR
jgi:hypothetical protein